MTKTTVTEAMVAAAAKALAEAEASHDRKEPWINHAARVALTAAFEVGQSPAVNTLTQARMLAALLAVSESAVILGNDEVVSKEAMILVRAAITAAAPVTGESFETCPVCAEPLHDNDICATDIEMGICHAACLEGSTTVDLETGDEIDGPMDTYRYGDTAPKANGADHA